MDHYYRVKNERKTGIAELYSMGEAVKRSNVYRSELLDEDQHNEVDSLLERIRKLYIEITNDTYYFQHRNKDYEEDIKDYRAKLGALIDALGVDIKNPRTWSEWWKHKPRKSRHNGGSIRGGNHVKKGRSRVRSRTPSKILRRRSTRLKSLKKAKKG